MLYLDLGLLYLQENWLLHKADPYKEVVRDIGVLADVVAGYYYLLLICF